MWGICHRVVMNLSQPAINVVIMVGRRRLAVNDLHLFTTSLPSPNDERQA
jgi:hypothetical protein